jgi:uncharacterized protein (DUF849 family)
MNFAMFRLADKPRQWKHDWEQPYLRSTEDGIFRNTFGDIRKIIERLGEGHGTRFELECYDIGHLYNLSYFVETGLIKPPFLIQSVFGVMGGIGSDPESVLQMKQTADRLFGRDYIWSLFAAGRAQLPICTMGAVMGANVRVGLEDSLYLERGKLATSNAEQVTKMRRILTELGMDIASPDEGPAPSCGSRVPVTSRSTSKQWPTRRPSGPRSPPGHPGHCSAGRQDCRLFWTTHDAGSSGTLHQGWF